MQFVLALLKAIPILYSVWQELEKDKQVEHIENDVFTAWADKFGELQYSKRIASNKMHSSKPEQRPDGERDLPG